MGACPYCKVVGGGLFSSGKAWCTSPKNPSNNKRGDMTGNGVAWARCVNGEYAGITFKQCPHYKRKTKRSH